MAATDEAAAAASRDSAEVEAPEGPGCKGGASGQQPLATALNAQEPPASESMEDGSQAAQQSALGDLTAFAPCIRCVEKNSDKALVCICTP